MIKFFSSASQENIKPPDDIETFNDPGAGQKVTSLEAVDMENLKKKKAPIKRPQRKGKEKEKEEEKEKEKEKDKLYSSQMSGELNLEAPKFEYIPTKELMKELMLKASEFKSKEEIKKAGWDF